MRRALPVTAAAVLLLAVGPFLGEAAVAGATSVESGWWTAAPVPPAPDAPDGALVVQGGADPAAPIAYAAVKFALMPDEAPQSLTLALADGAVSIPNSGVVACPLTGSFVAAHGEPAANGPRYDCSTSATGALLADGSGYAVDVSGLPHDDTLAVAVLPTTLADRVVFAQPGPQSLQSTTVAAPASPATEPAAAPAATEELPPVPAAHFDIVDVPPPPDAADTAGAVASAAARGTAEARPTAATTSGDDDGSPAAALVFVGLALIAAVLWASASGKASAGAGDTPAV